jgi:acetolactate synthase-1/2/3 large subunit
MEQVSGGEVVARMLKNEGVEKVFGIIDGTYFGFYSSLRKHGIDLITPRHETCAAHMAGAYARLTGKLGVCMASNGPGVANILPGVAVENGEGNRVLLITSTRRVGIGYPDRGGTYQYFNQVGVTKPMTKWSGGVPSFARVPEFMKRAFRTSWSGRPGVVHVDVPEDIMNGQFQIGDLPLPQSYRRVDPIWPSPKQVEQAAEMLVKAEHPIIHAGSGVIHALAFEELQRVAELLCAPVSLSWAGRGAFPEDHELIVPMSLVSLNHEVRNAADLVLTLGSRIGETDWWGKAPYWRKPSEQKMIQVDIDEDILGLNKPATLAVLADIKVFLQQLIPAIEARKNSINLSSRRDRVSHYNDSRKRMRAKLDKHLDDMGVPMNTALVAHTCQQVFDKDAVAVIDGGNSAIWGHFFHEFKVPLTVLSTPKFGMLGAGVGQATGAAVARPDKQVYCMIGDGAMAFHQQEIETAVRNKLKPIFIVCCDKQWGMVKMNQQFTLKPFKTLIFKSLSPEETINTDFNEIQFDKLAESMGAHGERVRSAPELKAAIERSLKSGKCAVIHVDVDPVKHMWAPSLRDFKAMHQEPKGK